MKAVHSVSNKRQKNIILVIAIILIVLYYLHPRQRLISTGLRQYEKSNKHRVHLRDVIGVDFEKIYNCDNNEYLLKQDGISNLKWITIPINSSSFFFILRNRIVYFECFSHKGFDEVIFEKGEFFFTFYKGNDPRIFDIDKASNDCFDFYHVSDGKHDYYNLFEVPSGCEDCDSIAKTIISRAGLKEELDGYFLSSNYNVFCERDSAILLSMNYSSGDGLFDTAYKEIAINKRNNEVRQIVFNYDMEKWVYVSSVLPSDPDLIKYYLKHCKKYDTK